MGRTIHRNTLLRHLPLSKLLGERHGGGQACLKLGQVWTDASGEGFSAWFFFAGMSLQAASPIGVETDLS